MLYYGEKTNKGGRKGMAHRRNPASDIGKVLGIALIGGAAADAVDYLMGKIAPATSTTAGLKPWQRGALQIGVGAVAGGLLATKYPQIAVAIAAGNIAIGGQYLVGEARIYMAQPAALPACTPPMTRATPTAPCALPTPAPAPGATPGATPPGAGFQARRYPAYVNR